LLGHSTFRFEEVVGVKDQMQEMVSNFFVNPNPFTYSFLVVLASQYSILVSFE
jgi:hypothetical protein